MGLPKNGGLFATSIDQYVTLGKQHVVTSRPIAKALSTSMVVVQRPVWP